MRCAVACRRRRARRPGPYLIAGRDIKDVVQDSQSSHGDGGGSQKIKASPVAISTACAVPRQACVKQDPRPAVRFMPLLFSPCWKKCSFRASASETTATVPVKTVLIKAMLLTKNLESIRQSRVANRKRVRMCHVMETGGQ